MDFTSDLISLGATLEATGELRWQAFDVECAALDAKQPSIAWLAQHRVVDVVGEDARAFLQGQLSNDVFALADGSGQWQGYCQPQGRLLATFPLVRIDESNFWLALPTSIAAAIVKRLSMFVLRSKVKISVSEDPLIGAVHATLHGTIPLIGSRALFRVPAAQFISRWRALLIQQPSAIAPISMNGWDYAGICDGIADIRAGAQDLFVPQMLGWDRVGVNFKKGCYPGQEVVARAHYRGAVKRKLARVSGTGAPPAAGAALNTAADAAGHLALVAATSHSAWLGLASMLPELRGAARATFDGIGECAITALDV